jgi:hypothetical protein
MADGDAKIASLLSESAGRSLERSGNVFDRKSISLASLRLLPGLSACLYSLIERRGREMVGRILT